MLSVMSQNTSSVTVKVWNISDSISSEFFETFFKTADPCAVLKKCDEHFLVSIAQDRAPLIVQKLNDWKVGGKPLKACIVEKKNVTRVCIWNLSDLLSDAFFSHLFSVLNCKSSAQKYKGYYIIETTKELAEEIVQKLNKCSVADTIFRASIIGKEDSNFNAEGSSRHISVILQDFYFQEKNSIIRKAIQTYGKLSEFYSYKTMKCNGSCGGDQTTCSFYHSPGDKRRSPVLHRYRKDICPYQSVKPKMCSNGDRCTYSHNIYEQMFHPTNIHTVLCPSAEVRLCKKMPFCKFCHKETPETFYTESWSHLLTFGIKNTFKFFVGSINETVKLLTSNDIKICLLSRCEELLDIANKCISDVTSTLKMTSIVLDKKWINLDDHQIYLGTPEIVASYHKRLLTSSTKGALIIEDVSGILEDAENRLHLLSIVERLKLASKTSKVNVVFVSRYEEPLLAVHLSRMFGVSLVNVNDASISDIPDILKTQKNNPSVNYEKDQKINHIIDEPKSGEDPLSFPFSNSKGPSSVSWSDFQESRITQYIQDSQYIQESSSAPYSVKKRPHLSSEDSYSRKIVKSSPETSTKAFVSDMTTCKRQIPQDKLDFTHNNMSVHQEGNNLPNNVPEPPFGSDKQETKNKIPLKRLSEAELNLKNTFGEELYRSFVLERKEILSCHESEYDAYKTFPDLHPNYDKYYSDFLQDYVKKYPVHNSEDHKAAVWKEHWKTKLKMVMDDEWKDQKRKLLLKYQDKLAKESEENLKKLQMPLPINNAQINLSDSSHTRSNDNDPRTNFSHSLHSRTNINDPRISLSNSSHNRTNDIPIKENEKKYDKSFVEEDPFTVEKTLDVLEQFSSKLGVLGPSMLAMVESSRKLGINTIEGLNIFTEEENVTLINMVIGKLKALKQKYSEEPNLTRAINMITRLLEYAKNPPLHLILDIRSLARCTLGNSPTTILEKINKILTSKKRMNTSKEEINELFLKVCSVQFELQN